MSDPSNARRIVLVIPGARLTELMIDFPVYVDVTQADFRPRLDPAQISFKRRFGPSVETLPHELQSYETTATTGRLRAWVLLPSLSNTADNVFELQYGDRSVAAAPNPAGVWRNAFKAVFHLESATGPVVDSVGLSPGTPQNLQANAAINAFLGKGVDFDGNSTAGISFANPITGSGPSTVSAWILQGDAVNKDAIVSLGSGSVGNGRFLNSQFNNNQVALGFINDDWLNTGLDIEDEGWRLLHWTYDNRVSHLYQDSVRFGVPFTHANAANTQGLDGWMGGALALGYDNSSGLNATLDEVRISNTARSPGWIAAEYSNQTNPTGFVIASSPGPLP